MWSRRKPRRSQPWPVQSERIPHLLFLSEAMGGPDLLFAVWHLSPRVYVARLLEASTTILLSTLNPSLKRQHALVMPPEFKRNG